MLKVRCPLGLFALLAFIPVAQAASQSLLPLERGAYALETTSCPQRSRAEIMTYWGDRLNQSTADCAISNVKSQGSVYTFTSRCKIEGERKRQIETVVLRIADKKHFVVVSTVNGKPDETAYKWCSYSAFD
ncbi:hypothetical protein [Methylobacterium sp. E-045]|uniref:hypothetical protein n=1 Tax=Methylobacterium sp. E-045 TaxID=2836575 RepID=UPI001FB862EE|nr:hypothetical protein [Methylobacterium sp. E-045]MCJ2128193.1 hypothetical protein [Methylobacterium sp. E-045]